jgi:hypothetical protein
MTPTDDTDPAPVTQSFLKFFLALIWITTLLQAAIVIYVLEVHSNHLAAIDVHLAVIATDHKTILGDKANANDPLKPALPPQLVR